jgi:hypothetical protein
MSDHDKEEQHSSQSPAVDVQDSANIESVEVEVVSEAASAPQVDMTSKAMLETNLEASLKPNLEPSTETSPEFGSTPLVEPSEKLELTEEQRKELLSQLSDNTPGPAPPTETYTHPVTGREVYVTKQKELGPTAAIATMSLLMFVGGGLATLIMVARAFDLHGDMLVWFVIGSCGLILGMAGGLLLKTLGDKGWIGAVVGACFGVVGGIIIYLQTSHHSWWH